MITNIIVTAFLAGLDAITSLLPSWQFPTQPTDGTGMVAIVGQFNDIFPVFTVLQILVAIIGLQLILYGFDLAVWVYHQFWGSD